MQKSQLTLSLLVIASLLILFITPQLGLQLDDDSQRRVLLDIRLPRVLFAFIAGAGLALCGMVFQTLFHNPLATPFTLGVASGASLGAALYVAAGISFSLFGIAGGTLAAFIGALFAITIVYSLSRLRRQFEPNTLLLIGVALSFFFSSLILFSQYLSNITDSFRIIRWLMGSLTIIGYHDIFQLLPFVALVTATIIWAAPELNLLTTGDELALSRGVNVTKLHLLLFFITSLCVGAIVALCGPIGFVGMMVPHICRLLIGNDHHTLTPATLLFGGSFLVLCDTVARLILAPTELPVGIITTLLGGPFFLWLLIRKK